MKSLYKYILVIILLILTSCYITPESETDAGNISINLPLNTIIQKSVPYGTAGFEIIIAGSSIADPQNITEDDEIVFYYKDIELSGDVFIENEPGEYTISLNDVPEGDNLYMVIKYQAKDLQYDPVYEMEYGTYGYFITETPFKVESNKTTNITLTTYIYYNDPRPV